MRSINATHANACAKQEKKKGTSAASAQSGEMWTAFARQSLAMLRAASRMKQTPTTSSAALSQRFTPPGRCSGSATSTRRGRPAPSRGAGGGALIGISELPVVDQRLIFGRRVAALHDREVVEALDDAEGAA